MLSISVRETWVPSDWLDPLGKKFVSECVLMFVTAVQQNNRSNTFPEWSCASMHPRCGSCILS